MDVVSCCRLRLYPDPAQEALFEETCERYRRACDWLSQRAFSTGVRGGRGLHGRWYGELRDRFGLPSQMACSACRDVAARYKAWDRKNAELEKREKASRTKAEPKGRPGRKNPRSRKRPKKRKRVRFKKPQLGLCRDRNWSFVQDSTLLSIGTLEGRAKVAFESRGMEQWLRPEVRYGESRLVRDDKDGSWWLHVSCTVEVGHTSYEDSCGVAGVDVGMRFLWWCAFPDGSNAHFSGKGLAPRRARFKRVRESLQRKHTPSARRRLKKLGRRENRWAEDVNHVAAKALVGMLPEGCTVALENLKDIKERSARVRKGARCAHVSWPYASFQGKVAHKCAKRGIRVVKVRAAGTSQTCPVCGHRDKAARDRARHLFECPVCGHRSNDDLSAARNIRNRGMRYCAAAIKKEWEKQAGKARASG